jgi:hypothetical protein
MPPSLNSSAPKQPDKSKHIIIIIGFIFELPYKVPFYLCPYYPLYLPFLITGISLLNKSLSALSGMIFFLSLST